MKKRQTLLFPEDQIGPEKDPFDDRKFVVINSENIIDCDYQVGRIDLVTEPVATAAAIAIAITVSDGKTPGRFA